MTILVAKHDLRPNTPLDAERDLEPKKIPAEFLGFAMACLTPGESSHYKAQRVNRLIGAGQPVMLADFSLLTEFTLKAGMVAISVPVRGAHGVSGLPVPGDHVKVMVTQTKSVMENGTPMMQPHTVVAANGASFKVVAVGSRLSKPRQQVTAMDQYTSSLESEMQQSVTIEATEEQGKEIVELSNAYRLPITLMLMPPEQNDAATMPGK